MFYRRSSSNQCIWCITNPFQSWVSRSSCFNKRVGFLTTIFILLLYYKTLTLLFLYVIVFSIGQIMSLLSLLLIQRKINVWPDTKLVIGMMWILNLSLRSSWQQWYFSYISMIILFTMMYVSTISFSVLFAL